MPLGRDVRAVVALVAALTGLAVGLPFIEFALSYLLGAATGIDSTPRFLVPVDLPEGAWAWHVGVIRLVAGLVAVGLLLPWGNPTPPRRGLFAAALTLIVICGLSAVELLAYAADFGCLFNPDAPWDCRRD